MDLREIAADIDAQVVEAEGWGMAMKARCALVEPSSREEIREVLAFARQHRLSVGFRGSGCSYGDASLNAEGLLVDLSKYNKILSLDAETGILVAESGVTLEDIWRQSIRLGYWPPVVSGTMYPTLGGLLSMNVHGKNNWRSGTIAEHVQSFRLLTIEGEELVCSREQNSELFFAAISGFGMLGCFLDITLQLKKVHSGYLDVEAIATPTIADMICWLDENKEDYDYLVGWIDCFPRKEKHLGRGLIHAANYLKEGEDPNPIEGLTPVKQDLPERLFGVIPKSWMWRFLKPFLNDLGMRTINAAKYHLGAIQQTRGRPHRQAHAAFAFLLDYVPDWKLGYRPGGLIQYQSFMPKETAHEVHPELIRIAHRHDIVPYLGVYKRHRPDSFLMTHAVDGFSFAMDIRVTKDNRERVWKMTREMDELVVNGGGRLYFAKDACTTSETVRKVWKDGQIEELHALKQRFDPQSLLQTDLARRLFPDWFRAAE
ncbi:MAG: FAD-binding protein [Planctomycetota bacterium]|nr:MAG: FAD-binding protein [Planctomycetota bacterium]